MTRALAVAAVVAFVVAGSASAGWYRTVSATATALQTAWHVDAAGCVPDINRARSVVTTTTVRWNRMLCSIIPTGRRAACFVLAVPSGPTARDLRVTPFSWETRFGSRGEKWTPACARGVPRRRPAVSPVVYTETFRQVERELRVGWTIGGVACWGHPTNTTFGENRAANYWLCHIVLENGGDCMAAITITGPYGHHKRIRPFDATRDLGPRPGGGDPWWPPCAPGYFTRRGS